MARTLRTLVIEQSEDEAALVTGELTRGGFTVRPRQVKDEAGLRDALTESGWDLIVADWSTPELTAPAALAILQEHKLEHVPFIVVADGEPGEEAVIGVLRAGARDFVHKRKLGRLIPTLERELRDRDERMTRASMEEQLRQALKLEAVGALAGGIAHDFNNLLFVMLSYSNLLLEDASLTQAQRADLEQIRRAAERASDLTKQLLAYSRQQILQPRVLDLNQVLEGVEQMLRRVIGAPIGLEIVAAPALGKVHADLGQLEQIVVNLVINARDAMPGGGRITLETKNVVVDASHAGQPAGVAPGSYVMLAVSDTGTGMTPEIRARIFDPFFTTKEKGKGTGLGLATVFGIVKQSGGHIVVKSAPEQGSRFEIYLPATDRPPELPKMTSSPGTSLLGTETVLLVEDEEQVRVVSATILRRAGYHVLEAKNGGEALLTCELHAGRIHLLLTDVIMPLMSGPQLAGRLLPLRPEMKVLYMSGFTDNAIMQQGVVPPEINFLQKPAAPKALLTSVRQVLDS